MKRYFMLIALAFALTVNAYSQTQSQPKKSSKPSAADTLIDYERQGWEAVKQKDYKFFIDRYAEDFYGIFPGQVNLTKSQLLELFKRFDLNDYQLTNIKVTMLNKNAAVLNYEIDERVTSGGKAHLNHNAITAAWTKRGGKWFCVFFKPYILSSKII